MSDTKMMKIRIESDGTATSTRVVNAESGQAIDGVRAIHWDVEVGELPAYATLEMNLVPGKLTGEAKIIANSFVERIAAFVQAMKAEEPMTVINHANLPRHIAQRILMEFTE